MFKVDFIVLFPRSNILFPNYPNSIHPYKNYIRNLYNKATYFLPQN